MSSAEGAWCPEPVVTREWGAEKLAVPPQCVLLASPQAGTKGSRGQFPAAGTGGTGLYAAVSGRAARSLVLKPLSENEVLREPRGGGLFHPGEGRLPSALLFLEAHKPSEIHMPCPRLGARRVSLCSSHQFLPEPVMCPANYQEPMVIA